MLIITRWEATHVLDVLKAAKEDIMLDEDEFRDAISIIEGVLDTPEIPLEDVL